MRTEKGDLFTELILEVFKLSGLLVSEGDRISGEFGLSSARWKVLGAVSLADTPLTVAQISREMGQTRQSVQRIADSMVERGHFLWKSNPEHKRAKLLHLTAKGERIHQQILSVQAPWANETGKQLGLKELKDALSTIRKLVERFEA